MTDETRETVISYACPILNSTSNPLQRDAIVYFEGATPVGIMCNYHSLQRNSRGAFAGKCGIAQSEDYMRSCIIFRGWQEVGI
jgi:hypothetical protein